MKLIIDIPETMVQDLKDGCFGVQHNVYELVGCIMNGTPLDDVKAEMQKVRRFHVGNFEDDNPIDYGVVIGFDKALKILDNIGKAESEDME